MSTRDPGVPLMKWNYFGGAKPKRKLPMDEELCEDLPAMKVHLTEEKMANQLSGLHLSSSYTTHGASQTPASTTTAYDLHSAAVKIDSDDPFAPSSSRHCLPTLTICEEIKALQNKTMPLLPHGFVNIQRPTKALVLWQPPVDDIGRTHSPRSFYNFGSAFSRREGIIFQFNGRILSNATTNSSATATTDHIDDDEIDNSSPKAIETQTPAPSLDDLTSMTDAEMDNNNTAAYCFFPQSDFCR